MPTPVVRFMHSDNLDTCLRRGGLHAPTCMPQDGLPYRLTHSVEVQERRAGVNVPCGPGGVIHDYVPFYFGPLSPMLLNLKTGRVAGYTEGQEPLIYLVSNCQRIAESGTRFVFTDGHGLAAYTSWFDNLADLDKVDWQIVNQRYWSSTTDDMDRQRRKQAEFLVRGSCDWALIEEIVVISAEIAERLDRILRDFPAEVQRPVVVRAGWYYY